MSSSTPGLLDDRLLWRLPDEEEPDFLSPGGGVTRRSGKSRAGRRSTSLLLVRRGGEGIPDVSPSNRVASERPGSPAGGSRVRVCVVVDDEVSTLWVKPPRPDTERECSVVTRL